MMMRIKKQFVNLFLPPVIILFTPYTQSPDSPRHSQQPPPESQTAQISHTPTPAGGPRHSRPPPGSQTIQMSHIPPRLDSPQGSQSPPGFQTIQPTNPTDQPAPRPGGERPHADGYVRWRMEWPLLVMGVCFTAIGVALQAFQTSEPLPMIFHWFCMLLELSFVFAILSMYVRPLSQQASLVMDQAAILLGTTAFMLAISMNFPSPFLEISATLCFVLVLVITIMVANIFVGG